VKVLLSDVLREALCVKLKGRSQIMYLAGGICCSGKICTICSAKYKVKLCAPRNADMRTAHMRTLTRYASRVHYRPTVPNEMDTPCECPFYLAQREGFEPSCGVIHKLISSPFGYLEVIEQYYPNLALF